MILSLRPIFHGRLPEFLEFLHSLQQCTNVEIEHQGLAELMDTIHARKTKCQAENKAQTVKASTRVGKEDSSQDFKEVTTKTNRPHACGRAIAYDLGILLFFILWNCSY
jgi:hypothetical protein